MDNDCIHEWEGFMEEPGIYRNSVCLHCGAFRHQDFVNGTEIINPYESQEDYEARIDAMTDEEMQAYFAEHGI